MGMSVVAICNVALRLINVSTINSLDEACEAARACSTYYESVRDSLLRSCVWNFARSFSVLAEMSNITHPRWSYVYSLPPQCLYCVDVFSSTSNVHNKNLLPEFANRFELSYMNGNEVVLTNVASAGMDYVRRVTDSSLFDVSFVEVLETKLAAALALPLTGNAKIAEFYSSKGDALLARARALSASEGKRLTFSGRVVSRYEASRR